VSARHILVATGGRPTKPDVPGIELAITSDEAFHLAALPRRVLIYGGGYVAVEFASIFAGLGVEVSIIYRGARILRDFDSDLGVTLAAEMAKKGVAIRLQTQLQGIVRDAAGLTVSLDDGTELSVDSVLAATGRAPNTAGLGLEAAGVELDWRGAVRVAADYRSNVPSILAIGDVIDRVQLTPVALAEGMYVAELLFGAGRPPINYENIATAVFSHPNVGTVGLSEAQALARGAVQVFRSRFRALRHTLSGRDEQTLMKIVVDAASDRVLGVHMVGPDAGEIIQGFAVALQCGATKAQFDATIGIHPTSAEELVTMRTPVTP
jgi:glutathione reductase (NADPH)